MTKLDYKKELKALYYPSAKECAIVEAPAMNFLMIDGAGDPNHAPAFQTATEALFSVSYTLKFMIKKGEQGVDYAVMPLEGLWWAEDMSQFSVQNKSNWLWTLMIMQPPLITAEQVEAAKAQAAKKKTLPALPALRFESFAEGLSAQIMHIGPFAAEGPTVEKLHTFIIENGYVLNGKHHEIYLSDFTRTAPEKMKTVVRYPIRPATAS
jgi:hypothetical protein